MRYFREMFENVHGFNDGRTVPPDAQAARTVYIRLVNGFAAHWGSDMRLAAFNISLPYRTLYTIFCVLASEVAGLPAEELANGDSPALWQLTETAFLRPDDTMQNAVNFVRVLRPDRWVRTSVEIDPGFDDFVAGIANILKPKPR